MGEIRHPLVPMHKGFGVGSGVLGILTLVVMAVDIGELLPMLVGGFFFGVLGGLTFFVIVARMRSSQIELLDRVDGPIVGRPRPAYVAGLLLAAALGVVLTAAMWATVWLPGDGSPILPGALIALGLASVLEAQDLRRWQDETGCEIFTRASPGLVAWTSAQARERLVIVDQHSASVATERADP